MQIILVRRNSQKGQVYGNIRRNSLNQLVYGHLSGEIAKINYCTDVFPEKQPKRGALRTKSGEISKMHSFTGIGTIKYTMNFERIWGLYGLIQPSNRVRKGQPYPLLSLPGPRFRPIALRLVTIAISPKENFGQKSWAPLNIRSVICFSFLNGLGF